METEGYEADLGVPNKVSGDAEGSVGGWFREQLEFWGSFMLLISTYNARFSAHTHTQAHHSPGAGLEPACDVSCAWLKAKPSDD